MTIFSSLTNRIFFASALLAVLGGLTVLGLGTFAYSCLYERRAFTLRKTGPQVGCPASAGSSSNDGLISSAR